MTARTEGGVVEISTGWKTRKVGGQRFENTYDMYTKGKAPKIDPTRIKSLVKGEMKDRVYNPVTGTVHYNDRFVGKK
jgi:hypothetical protein